MASTLVAYVMKPPAVTYWRSLYIPGRRCRIARSVMTWTFAARACDTPGTVDEIHGNLDQLYCQLGQAFPFSDGRAELDDQILTHDVAVLTEPVGDRSVRRIGVRVEFRTCGVEDTD